MRAAREIFIVSGGSTPIFRHNTNATLTVFIRSFVLHFPLSSPSYASVSSSSSPRPVSLVAQKHWIRHARPHHRLRLHPRRRRLASIALLPRLLVSPTLLGLSLARFALARRVPTRRRRRRRRRRPPSPLAPSPRLPPRPRATIPPPRVHPRPHRSLSLASIGGRRPVVVTESVEFVVESVVVVDSIAPSSRAPRAASSPTRPPRRLRARVRDVSARARRRRDGCHRTSRRADHGSARARRRRVARAPTLAPVGNDDRVRSRRARAARTALERGRARDGCGCNRSHR